MSNNVIEVKKDELRGLYNILTNYPSISKEQVQNEMHKVFGEDVFKPQDIKERVKTFEDACRELGNTHPFVLQYNTLCDNGANGIDVIDIAAYLKLRIIVEALNEGWHPTFSEDEWRYFPWFYAYSKEEWNNMSDEDKRRVVGRSNSNADAYGGLVFAHSSYASSNANSGDCFRLAFKSEGLAVYAGKQFIDIWVDYICA